MTPSNYTDAKSVPVKNVSRSRGPLTLEGCGVLKYGEKADALDTQHTRDLIDAGHIVEVAAKRKPRATPTTDKTED